MEEIPIKLSKISCLLASSEVFLVEVKINKKKQLLCCIFNPNKTLIENHMNELRKASGIHLHMHDYIFLVCGFNSEISERPVHDL